MKLRAKPLNLAAEKPIAVLHKSVAERLRVSEDSRIKIRKYYKDNKKRKWVTAVVDVAVEILNVGDIALTQDVFKELGLRKGDFVDVSAEIHPFSVSHISKKMRGQRLNFTEMYSIISDISQGRLTESEIAFFVSAVYYNGLSFEEMVFLTKAMVKTGGILKHKEKFALDLHSCGGVAGNRTSPIVISIVAAAIDYLKLNAVFPKTASRAITSAAGTADVMETVSRVEFLTSEIRKILKKTKACLVWNSALKLSPADDKIVKIETLLSLDAEPQLISSVMSKKIADGATHVIIDIPYGPSSKFSFKDAIRIKNRFLQMADRFKIKTKPILTDGREPIGNKIGPIPEMIDVLRVLKNEKKRAKDLETKSLMISAELLALTGKMGYRDALSICKLLLYSGRAYKKFRQIVLAQGGKVNFEQTLEVAKYSVSIKSPKNGVVTSIMNKKIALVAKMAGCPGDKSAGLTLYKKKGDKVIQGDILFTIYSESKDKLKYAEKIAKQVKPYEIR
ncbi:MAG: thymidine phosphorylase [archaeon]|nr:MAG: thymidine phosphorylase [archaeon]